MREVIAVDLPVDEVTLMEDRAHVTRRGSVKIPTGSVRLTQIGIAPVLADKTLAVNLTRGSGAKLVDLRVIRQWVRLDEDLPEDVAKLDAMIRARGEERAALNDERTLVAAQVDGLGQANTMMLADLAEDAAWGKGDPGQWEGQLSELREREAPLVVQQAELGVRATEIDQDLADLQARRNQAARPTTVRRATLVVDLDAESKTDLELQVDYIVPGACWRPYHTATLAGGESPKVRFQSDACVWQWTGEDWQDAQLFFSTERPSLGTEPPLLTTDRVASHKTDKKVIVEAREQTVHTSGLGAAEEVAPEVPGIDDGGEPMHLKGRSRADVPSDGRPYRVPIFELESPATGELVSMPELAPAVILRSEQENRAEHAILAGPVDLIRNSGLVGRTSVLFIAPGEKFELGWGPDLALRVHRVLEELEDETKLLSAWTTSRKRVKLSLSNIGPEAKKLRVTERIPVSEVEKVEVLFESENTTGDVQPDDNGFLRWELELSPFSREKVRLSYGLKKHSDVVGL